MEKILYFINKIGNFIMGIILLIWFIASIISVIVYRIREGHFPIGQGYGKK